jgi:hypothetical protein
MCSYEQLMTAPKLLCGSVCVELRFLRSMAGKLQLCGWMLVACFHLHQTVLSGLLVAQYCVAALGLIGYTGA